MENATIADAAVMTEALVCRACFQVPRKRPEGAGRAHCPFRMLLTNSARCWCRSKKWSKIRNSQKSTSKRKVLPGYVLVEVNDRPDLAPWSKA